MNYEPVNTRMTGESNDSILSYFPLKTPRPSQIELCNEVQKAIDEGYEYIIIEAPPGLGKSPVAIAVCRYCGNGYICTSQKSLQAQYIREFSNYATQVTGRSNWVCRTRMIDRDNNKKDKKDRYSDEEKDIYCDRGACQGDSKFVCPGKPVPDPENNFAQSKDHEFAGYSASRKNMYWQLKSGYRCFYWKRKMEGLKATITIQNYTYMLTEHEFVKDFAQREVMIADEGHNLESQIQNQIKVEITLKHLDLISEAIPGIQFPYFCSGDASRMDYEMKNQKRMPQEQLMPAWIDWLKRIYNELPVLAARYEDLIKQLKADEIKMSQVPQCEDAKDFDDGISILTRKITSLNTLTTKIDFFLKDYQADPENWIIQPEQAGSKIVKGEFKPIMIARYAKPYFFSLGKINIIMSATISDFDLTAKSLGLEEGEYKKIRMTPTYGVNTNMIYMLNVANMSYERTREPEDFKAAMVENVRYIDALLDKFPDKKGIIHAGTYKIAQFIKNHSRHQSRIMIHDSSNRDKVIRAHAESNAPVVLCSPSITEGIDLKFDSSRFQIIVKIPYPDLSDLRIKIRANRDPSYYDMLTARTLCQAIGRSVRDENDWAYTFVLDSRFPDFCKSPRMKGLLANFNRHVKPLIQFKAKFGVLFPEKAEKMKKMIERVREETIRRQKERNTA